MDMTRDTAPSRPGASGLAAGWGRLVHSGALLFAAALSPSTYTPPVRRAVAIRICLAGSQMIPWFTLLAALFSLVLVHIVVVTAQSYGLSHLALGMVVRVLVVELLPLSAALYVALRAGSIEPTGSVRPTSESPVERINTARLAVLPRVVASALTVVALIALGGALALLLSYFGVYGFTPWGLSAFTRTVGQVFDPVVTLSLALKTLLFAVAVATVPAVAALYSERDTGDPASPVGTVRLFIVLIAIEILALTAEFY